MLEQSGALGFEGVELGEVGVYAGLQGGGGGVEEGEVGFVACIISVCLCLGLL